VATGLIILLLGIVIAISATVALERRRAKNRTTTPTPTTEFSDLSELAPPTRSLSSNRPKPEDYFKRKSESVPSEPTTHSESLPPFPKTPQASQAPLPAESFSPPTEESNFDEMLENIRALIINNKSISGQDLQHLLQTVGMRADIAKDEMQSLDLLYEASDKRDPYMVVLADAALATKSDSKLVQVILLDTNVRTPKIISIMPAGIHRRQEFNDSRFVDAVLHQPIQREQTVETLRTILTGHLTSVNRKEASGV